MALQRTTTRRTGRKRDSVTHGVGTAAVTVKGKRATSRQRHTIELVLKEAAAENASRRVMVAVVMTITQESTAGANMGGGAHIGPYQQSSTWGTYSARMDPTRATRAFLAAWKHAHGSLRTAPGDLASAIEAVQHSGQPRLYAQWQGEATRTVTTYLGHDGLGAGASRTYAKRYEFTRGERNGQRETSWDAMGRLAEEVHARRWAAANVLHYVSDDELRAGVASLSMGGDEAWLIARPTWEWGARRTITEMVLRVLADRWDVMPGGVLIDERDGPTNGRWLVHAVSGTSLDSPEATVTLRRPVRLAAEPAHELVTTSSGASVGGTSDLLSECEHISAQNRAYVWGGGHGKSLKAIGPKEGLDCSGAVSLALYRAGMWHGDHAMVSGDIAAKWGKQGRGTDFTVYANATHVWIQFEHGSVKRFDTSPQGCGASGPHVRRCARNDQARFTPRHW